MLGDDSNLASANESLQSDTEWLASRLSGGNAPPPGDDFDETTELRDMIALVHSKTPAKKNRRHPRGSHFDKGPKNKVAKFCVSSRTFRTPTLSSS